MRRNTGASHLLKSLGIETGKAPDCALCYCDHSLHKIVAN